MKINGIMSAQNSKFGGKWIDIFAFDLYRLKIAKNITLQLDSFHGSHVFGLIMSSLSLEKSRLINFVLKNFRLVLSYL